ncbi:MAG: lysylphosphatidylglycerol synthase domain-containing protein [Acidobacteriota bacterium]
MKSEPQVDDPGIPPQRIHPKHINRLKIAALALTLGGTALFAYFVYSVGIGEIVEGIEKIGFGGFAVLMLIYFIRMCVRAWAWKLSVYQPYALKLKDTIPAVIIGEAMSSMIPLGILISGTAKAVAVRKRLPLVVGLSSVATENLFYSLITCLFLAFGAYTFLRSVSLDESWVWTIDLLIGAIITLIIFGLVMVIKQWHLISGICEWLYHKGIAKSFLDSGRVQARTFENLIYGFYRRYPGRFIPICLLETFYHLLGITEGWYILTKIMTTRPELLTAFLLESVSRLISIVFKLIPFVIGVDEAGAQFVTDTLAIGAGIGVTLAIIRKTRILFWTAVGLAIILKRGLSLKEFVDPGE